MARSAAPDPLHIASRLLAAVVGGYAFVWGLTCLGIVLLAGAGIQYGEARITLFLLAFLVYLACVLWAIAARSLVRAWAVLAGGGAAMTAAAWLAAIPG